MSVRAALVGCGRWGEKLLRALSENPRAEVVAVADIDRSRLVRARAIAPQARRVRALDDALSARVDAVLIATPSASHAELALRALDAGADVFVEKPLALSAAQADRCAARAAALGRIGMVGHLLRYHPAVVRLVALARERALGEIVSLSACRLSTGGIGAACADRRPGAPNVKPGRAASSALWALGPHDLSLLAAVDPSPLRDAWGHLSPDGERCTLEASLESGVSAHVELCSTSPAKERRLRLVGASKVALFDDVRAPDRLVIAEGRGPGEDLARAREIVVPWREPLAVEIDHFLTCVEERTQPLTPLDEGASVVSILERVDASLWSVQPRAATG